MSSPTIKDVAKLAGVSISTVSRVMNNSKPVSPESRRKVEDAIEKLDFKRNEIARSLVMKRSNIIGVLVKDLGIPYMAQLVRGVEEVGRMYNYDMLLNSSYGDYDQEKKIVDFMLRKQAEAIIMITENSSPEIIVKLKENKNSFILLDRYYPGIFNTVTIDYKEAVRSMLDYLYELGHRDILFIRDNSQSQLTRDKEEAFISFMEEKSLKVKIQPAPGKNIRDGYQTCIDLSGEISDYTAVFTSMDSLAIGVINYCLVKGIKVPDDISVAGFGDSDMAKFYTPSLTTLHEPFYDIGAVAMRRIIKELRDEEKIDSTSVLPTQIIKRESVKKIK